MKLIRVGIDMPVPVLGRKMRQRGCNQSEIIAAGPGNETEFEADDRRLRRVTSAGPPALASIADDRQAIAAQGSEGRPGPAQVKKVSAIDDATTTGATSRTFAAALKRAVGQGAWGVTAAREP